MGQEFVAIDSQPFFFFFWRVVVLQCCDQSYIHVCPLFCRLYSHIDSQSWFHRVSLNLALHPCAWGLWWPGHGREGWDVIQCIISNYSSAQSNLPFFWKPTHTSLCAHLVVYFLPFTNMRSPLTAGFCLVSPYPQSNSRSMLLEWMMNITCVLPPSSIVNKSPNKRVSRSDFVDQIL